MEELGLFKLEVQRAFNWMNISKKSEFLTDLNIKAPNKSQKESTYQIGKQEYLNTIHSNDESREGESVILFWRNISVLNSSQISQNFQKVWISRSRPQYESCTIIKNWRLLLNKERWPLIGKQEYLSTTHLNELRGGELVILFWPDKSGKGQACRVDQTSFSLSPAWL